MQTLSKCRAAIYLSRTVLVFVVGRYWSNFVYVLLYDDKPKVLTVYRGTQAVILDVGDGSAQQRTAVCAPLAEELQTMVYCNSRSAVRSAEF